MPETDPSAKKSISRFMIVFILVSLLVLGMVSLWVGWCVREEHLTTYSLLVNLAAGFVVLFIATVVAMILARMKLKQAAVPILKLIQQLESEGRISQEAARRSVMAAVVVLSESNVNRAIERDAKAKQKTKCPVCWLDVELNSQRRCKHCLLPDALWNSKVLIEARHVEPEQRSESS